MCEAVEPLGRLKTRSLTAISRLVGSSATSAVATAPLSTRLGVSSPPVSVARITTDVWAAANAACRSVTPEANTQIHRSFRISLSPSNCSRNRAREAEHETDQLGGTRDQRDSADRRVAH